MRRCGPLWSVIGLLLLLLSASGAAARADDRAYGVIVKLKPATSRLARELPNVASPAPVFPSRTVNLRDLYVIPARPEEAEDLAVRLRNDPNVLWAEVNREIRICTVTNDPYWDSANSWGQGYDDMWAIKRIAADRAWDFTTGSPNVVVAITDTGIDLKHPDIVANLWRNADEIPRNGIDDDGNGYIDDIHGYDFVDHDPDPTDSNGHGTHCSGIVAATGNNGVGIVGVAYGCRVMAVKFLDAEGTGDDASAAQAIVYAADNGARVINMSWGRDGSATVIREALAYAASKGCVLVGAAGNDGIDMASFYPAADPNVIAVASVDHTDRRSDFSNYGPKIDLCAPGGESRNLPGLNQPYRSILSLRAANTDVYGDGSAIVNGQYYRAAGTSMAAPFVSGVAALVASFDPDLDAQAIRDRLMSTAVSVDSQNPGLVGRLGAGRVDAARAVSIRDAGISLLDVRVGDRDDKRLRAGRVGRLQIRLRATNGDIDNLQLSLLCPGGEAAVGIDTISVSHIAGGADIWTEQAFEVTPKADLKDGASIAFDIVAESGGQYLTTMAFSIDVSTYAEVRGYINEDAIWCREDSPYLVVASVHVASNATLTIEPGVDVRLKKATGITIDGVLSAQGTLERPIRFLPYMGDPWNQIVFTTGSHGTISYARVETAGAIDRAAVRAQLSEISITDSKIIDCPGYAIQIDAGTRIVLDGIARDGNVPTLLVTSGTLPADTSWTYNTDVRGTVVVPTGMNLSLGNGIKVRLASDGGFDVSGVLSGTKVQLLPSGSSWHGIHVGAGGSVVFTDANISHAKGTYGGIVQCNGGSADLTDCTISDGEWVGVLVRGGAARIRGCVIARNRTGIRVTSGNLDVRASDIYGNTDWGIECVSGASATAEDDYWGSPTGPLDDSDDRITGGLYNPTGRGNRVTDGVDYQPFINQSSESLQHRIEPGLRMVTVPTTDVGSWDALSDGRAGDLWVARWIAEDMDYAATPDPRIDTVRPGEGYWLRTNDALTITVDGAARPDEVAIPLASGWNQIGNPFLDDIPWNDASVRVRSGDRILTLLEAATEGILDPTCWGYDTQDGYVLTREGITPPADLVLRAWLGYWLRAYEACELVLSRIPNRSRTDAAAPDWIARIEARGAGGADTCNYFGLATKDMSAETPPGLDGMLDLSFENQGRRLGMQIMSSSAQSTWQVVLSGSQPGETVSLSWPKLRQCVPKGIELALTDERSGRTIDMMSRGALSVLMPDDGSPLRFTLTARKTGDVPLMITSLMATPSRANESIPITFNLTRSAAITIDILSLNGRAVRRVVGGRSYAGGIGSVVWDGRDAAGRRVPRGTYICEMIAESPTGQRARQIATIVITR